jgi:DNA-binding CsgD family transcriptional regulator
MGMASAADVLVDRSCAEERESRRGRRDEAETAARLAREELDGLAHDGRVATLAAEVEREIERAGRRASGDEVLDPPTPAELDVLRLLGSELSARQIGEQLFLSPNTVRSHTRSIYRKLGVNRPCRCGRTRRGARTVGRSGITNVRHASLALRADRAGDARGMPVREYSLVVEGELSDELRSAIGSSTQAAWECSRDVPPNLARCRHRGARTGGRSPNHPCETRSAGLVNTLRK